MESGSGCTLPLGLISEQHQNCLRATQTIDNVLFLIHSALTATQQEKVQTVQVKYQQQVQAFCSLMDRLSIHNDFENRY
jgi:curli biogenesis system outer membrane secretion channel CsgG